jgi:DNA (cytosine-5)-methyltransferase 1
MINIEQKYKKALSGYTFIDLFAGIGGFRFAFESFGAKCIYTSEWDVHAQKVYKDNFGDQPAGDITKADEKDIPKHDILCGGFPCQAFSISGKQKGFEDTRGTLFFDVARIAKHHKPKILFLENVKNFERHDSGKTLEVVIKTLNEIGYDVFYKVLDASHFGVPQKRERIYIIGFRDDLNVAKFEFPKTPNTPIKLKDFLLPDSQTGKYVINRDDIRIKNHANMQIDMFGNYPLKPIRIGTVNKGGQGERIYHECGHAITLSAYGGGVGAKTGLYYVNGKVRKLAPRECANIMGLPDNFVIHHSSSQAYKQFGNGVVVDVLQYIILDILKKGLIK